jgi:hypothetical protein
MDWCSVYLAPQCLPKYIYLSPPLIFPMLKCNKNNYVYKKTIIIIKLTDISLDRQASSASVIWSNIP